MVSHGNHPILLLPVAFSGTNECTIFIHAKEKLEKLKSKHFSVVLDDIDSINDDKMLQISINQIQNIVESEQGGCPMKIII